MEVSKYQEIFKQLVNEDLSVFSNQYDIFQLLLDFRENTNFHEEKELQNYAMKISKYTHQMAAYEAQQTGSGQFDDLYWKLLKFEAPNVFTSFIYYMEKNRPIERQFYRPREKTKCGFAHARW